MSAQHPDAAVLIRQIYDSVEDASGWDRFLESYRIAQGADQAVLALGDENFRDLGFVKVRGASDEAVREYIERWAWQDPWVDAMQGRLEEGAIEFGHNLCPDDVLVTLPIYKEFLAPNDWFYGIAAVILKTSTALSVISVARSRAKGKFGQQEYDLLKTILPHLQQAARMHGRWVRLQTEHRVLSEYMEQFGQGFALLTNTRHLLFANELLRQSFALGDGLIIRDGKLAASIREQDDELQAAVKVVARGTAPTRLMIRRRNGELAYGLLLFPANQTAAVPLGIALPAVAALVVDVQRKASLDEAMLSQLFSFTPAEASLAASIAAGSSLEEIAAERRISIHTVRTHLKRVFTKTGTSRQGELVRLLVSLGSTKAPGAVKAAGQGAD